MSPSEEATLIEEYRKAVRATYSDFHGPDSLRTPTAGEWREFSAACNLRDTGTHLYALPTGDHCRNPAFIRRNMVSPEDPLHQPSTHRSPLFIPGWTRQAGDVDP